LEDLLIIRQKYRNLGNVSIRKSGSAVLQAERAFAGLLLIRVL
jgi:hypothetical protein